MDEETLDIREYANVLLARWWLLALGPLLAVLAALGIFLVTPVLAPKTPEYQACPRAASRSKIFAPTMKCSAIRCRMSIFRGGPTG